MDMRLVYGIVALAVLLVACFIHWKAADCDGFGDFFIESYGWVTVLAVLLLGGAGFGIVFWGWPWKIVLSVAVPLVVLLIACAIHWCAACCLDFEDFFIEESGWVTVLAVCAASGIVLGCIYWIWWAVFLIGLGVALCVGVGFVLYNKYACSGMPEEEEEDPMEERKRNFRCPNCGAQLVENRDGGGKRFRCPYCNTYFTKKELRDGLVRERGDEPPEETPAPDLDDFEEEYFDACLRLDFRPYNVHTKRQLERRYSKLQDQVYRGDLTYWDDEDGDQSEDMLYAARSFFWEEEKAIGRYLDELDADEIRQRYESFCQAVLPDDEDNGDDEDDEDE